MKTIKPSRGSSGCAKVHEAEGPTAPFAADTPEEHWAAPSEDELNANQLGVFFAMRLKASPWLTKRGSSPPAVEQLLDVIAHELVAVQSRF